MKNEPLIIKKRGEDGSRVITVRIKEDILASLDQLAAESNYSRNELINIILRHGIENIKIENKQGCLQRKIHRLFPYLLIFLQHYYSFELYFLIV